YRVIPSLIYIRNVSYEFFKLLLNDLCYHISRLEDTRSSLKRIVAEIIAVSQADDSSGVVKDSSCLDRVISVAIAVLALSGLHVRRLMESLIV
ncbi:MAG: hypothetical protein F7B18_03820, partial [Desulfurococcales archaeon]|nr:hypothetical protein [Desulfurococcales archaeon]